MHCVGSVIRQNALKKHGIEGMLKCCQGEIFVSENVRKDLGNNIFASIEQYFKIYCHEIMQIN